MRVDELSPAPGATKAPKRVGRGIGGKGGKTAGAGTKGQHSRGRGKVARGFEGGQMPLKQRVPKLKGFNNPFRVAYTAVNLHSIAKLGVTDITPDVLVERGLLRKGDFVKILGHGELTKKLSITADKASASAQAAIEKAGGSLTIVPPKPPIEKGRSTPK